jgi:FkbM family methyltransferase
LADVPAQFSSHGPRSRAKPWLVRAGRGLVRRSGFDLVRYPTAESLDGHLASLLRRLRIECVVDVGAHHGEYGLLLRRFGYAGRIVSFEPATDSFSALSAVALRDSSWTVHRLALGAAEEERALNVPPRSALASFLPPSDYSLEIFGDEIVARRQERVSVTTLDSLLSAGSLTESSRPRMFLKIDAQGFDGAILQGAEQTLGLVQGLQTEVALKPLYDGVSPYLGQLGWLNDRGFELTGAFPVERDPNFRIIELDCVFARSS